MDRYSILLRPMLILILLAPFLVGCGDGDDDIAIEIDEEVMSISLTSSAFQEGKPIPINYTCDGKDISPPLRWSTPPEGTESFALVLDDPDAPSGTWIHWVIYNIPAEARSLKEAVPRTPNLADGGSNGKNSWNESGYGGPCPPSGSTHGYHFKLYALDTVLNIDAGASIDILYRIMNGHILGHGELAGIYTGEQL